MGMIEIRILNIFKAVKITHFLPFQVLKVGTRKCFSELFINEPCQVVKFIPYGNQYKWGFKRRPFLHSYWPKKSVQYTVCTTYIV